MIISLPDQLEAMTGKTNKRDIRSPCSDIREIIAWMRIWPEYRRNQFKSAVAVAYPPAVYPPAVHRSDGP
jgi:hypothetical protein